MKRQLVFKAWMIPVLVAALIVPGSAAMIILGPGLGLAIGQATAALIVLYAALQQPDDPIEVASSDDGRHRILVVANEEVEGPAVDRVALAAESNRSEDPAVVLVMAPARPTAISEWLSDVEPGRDRAQVLLVHSVAALAATGVEARAELGDADPVQAIEDTLRTFPADELILVDTDPEGDRGATKRIDKLEDRLPVPLHLVSTPVDAMGEPIWSP